MSDKFVLYKNERKRQTLYKESTEHLASWFYSFKKFFAPIQLQVLRNTKLREAVSMTVKDYANHLPDESVLFYLLF